MKDLNSVKAWAHARTRRHKHKHTIARGAHTFGARREPPKDHKRQLLHLHTASTARGTDVTGPWGSDVAVTATGVLAAGRGPKVGSVLRCIGEVIQLIQMRQSDVRKIVPCEPRAQPIIRLFW